MKTRLVALAAALALSTPFVSAQASGTGTLTVGSDSSPGTNAFTATSVGYLTFDSDAAVPFECMSSSLSGTVNRGVSLANGAVLGTITTASFGGCSMTDFVFPLNRQGEGTWTIHVVGNPTPKATAVNVLLTGANIYTTATGNLPYSCEFQMTGSIPATLNLSTQQLVVNTSSFPWALQAFTGYGTRTPTDVTCFAEVWTGDAANMTATYALSVTGGALSS